MFRLIFIFLFCFTTQAIADNYPSDTDLKTAYCIRVMQHGVDFFSSKLSNVPEMKPYQQKMENTLNRMKVYLLPKVPYLEVEPLMIATKNAERDLADANKSIEYCSKKYPNPATLSKEHGILYFDCITQQNKSDVEFESRSARLQSCQNPTWLPY